MADHLSGRHKPGRSYQRAELDAVTAQIATATAGITRYHTAFENGTMDDITAGPRITELRQQVARLQTRQAQLIDELKAQPAPPPPGTIALVRDYLHQVMTSGTSSARKAAVEALIAEVQLTDQGVIPVFKIPTADTTMPPPDPDRGTHEEQPPVRTMVRSVGRQGLEP